MRGVTETETEKGIMDPLWEFILDDHEDGVVAEESAGRRLGRLRGARKTVEKEKEGKEIGFFDSLFGCENDYSDETMCDNRDDSNNVTANDRRDTKKRNQLTGDGAGVDNSMWHLFGGGQKEPQKSTAKASKRSVDKTKTTKTIKTPAHPARKASIDKPAKKVGLLWRLRRKDRDTETVGTGRTEPRPNISPVTSAANPVVTDRTEFDAKQLSTKIQTKSIMKNSVQKDVETITNDKDEAIDPFRFLVEMVEAFDPFASDDSDSDSVVTEIVSEPVGHEISARAMVDIDRLVEQARNDSKVTEIRLNFRPESEEQHNDEEEHSQENSQTQELAREPMGDPYNLDDNSITASVTSASTRKMEWNATDYVAEHDNRGVQEDELDESSMSLLTPISRAPTKYRSQKFYDLENEHEECRPRGLRRLASCCTSMHEDVKFETRSHSVQSFPAATAFMPAARVVPDDENAEPMPFDVEKGNIASVEITETKGLQSVYSYDYESQENLDVYYSTMGVNPRSSMVVRKLGGRPSVNASAPNDEVIVLIEVSTVSETDCLIRQGMWWGAGQIPSSNTPGVEMVGRVYAITPQVASKHDIEVSQTVLSLTKWGANGRFLTIDPTKLVKVPPAVDPALAACLPETYLAAFQVLHLDQGYKTRYLRTSLRGKSVLIVGSMSNNMGKAIIELALHAGVANIYATAKQKHWPTLTSFGIMPLSPEPTDWIDRLEGTIDLVLASNGELREDVTPIHFRALHPKTGRLIMCGRRAIGNDVPTGSTQNGQASLVCAKNKEELKRLNRSYSFDIFEQWEKNLDLCKKDLVHLLQVLQDGAIKPKILDRIPLSKVSRAHELLESKRLSGFLICEPWMQSKKRAVYL